MKPYYDHGGITVYHGDWVTSIWFGLLVRTLRLRWSQIRLVCPTSDV